MNNEKFQIALHKELRSYLEFHSLSGIRQFTYPFFQKHKTQISRLMQECEGFSWEQLPQTIDSRTYAHVLSALYKKFYAKSFTGKKEFVKLDKKYEQEGSYVLTEFHRAVQFLKPYVEAVLVHGSMADQQITTYSDLDTLFIVKKETIQNPERLMSFRKELGKLHKYLFKTDPLQHHGFPVISTYELEYYPETILPVAALRESVVYYTEKDIMNITVRDSAKQAQEILQRNITYFKDVAQGKIALRGLFGWKLFLSKLMLLPTLYYQAKGLYVTKKESFSMFEGEYPHLYTPIAKASALRKNWKVPTITEKGARLLSFSPRLPIIPGILTTFTALSKEERC